MNVIQAIILGLVQGVTEYLPVSSSAHLVIVPAIFGWATHPLSFDLWIHAGTLIAIILFFRKKIYKLCVSIFSRDPDSRKTSRLAVRNLIISTIAVIPLYILIDKYGGILHDFSPITIFMLILFGIFMIAISYRKEGIKKYTDLTIFQAALIGLAQSLALISGVSRSGITIMAALMIGLKKNEANEYSFLSSIPVILGGFALDLLTVKSIAFAEPWYIYAVGISTSFIGGFIAIKFLMDYLNKHSLAVFGYYRILLGIILLAVFF